MQLILCIFLAAALLMIGGFLSWYIFTIATRTTSYERYKRNKGRAVTAAHAAADTSTVQQEPWWVTLQMQMRYSNVQAELHQCLRWHVI